MMLKVENKQQSLNGDTTFAAQGLSLVDGNNTFTAIGQDSLGRKDTNAVTVWLPASASFQYDANGNLLSDGRRGFDYDDENQLVRVTVTNAWKTEFQYDGRMRLRVRKEYAWLSGAFTQTNEVRYVYDGMLVIQERNGNNLPMATYTRGLDLSGSLQGAGGIGGLLARTDNGLWNGSGTDGAHMYYSADGNGNVTCLLNSKQVVVGRYVYDPYGNTLSMSGPMAAVNPYRFSSKEYMGNSGLYYYGYRFYEPSLQRWLNQDPLGEWGGVNLYGYVGNDPLNVIDPYGLYWGDYIPDSIDTAADWGAGLGDNLSFGLTGLGRRLLKYDDVINRCSRAYKVGQWTGVAVSTATGIAGGVKAAGAKGAGMEFSHWLPRRLGGPRSIWNGNYVTPARHYLQDPYRFPVGWQNLGPKLNPVLQQIDRIPNALKGTGLGLGYGLGSEVVNGAD